MVKFLDDIAGIAFNKDSVPSEEMPVVCFLYFTIDILLQDIAISS